MASTPSTLLGLELQGSQDNPGSWNANANGFVQAIEDAIAGSLLLSATSGDTDLSLNPYVADQTRLAIIRIGSGGNPITTNRRVRCTRFREYLVSNETQSGSFTVSFGYDNSNLVAVTRGCAVKVLIKSDGTVVQTSPQTVLATGQVDPTSLTALYAKFPVVTENLGIGVLSSTLATPPGSPTLNDRYIVPVGGLVAWSTHDASIATWNGASWDFTLPVAGMIAWDRANHFLTGYDAGGWQHGAVSDSIPAGGVAFVPFFQAAAPTGWTKSTTHNNKAIRIVSGTGGGSGGSVDFSTLFARTAVDDHTLTQAELPASVSVSGTTDAGGAHTPNVPLPMQGGPGAGAIQTTKVSFGNNNTSATSLNANCDPVAAHTHTFTITSLGSSTAHAHNLDLRVKYLDMIICSRD